MNIESSSLLTELEIISSYRFPLFCKDESYTVRMEQWIEDFILKINNSKILTYREKKQIELFAKGIVNCHIKYISNQYIECYKSFDKLMKVVKNNFPYAFVGKNDNNVTDTYYRIRKGDEEYNYLEMLHIPFSKRKLAADGRFSIAGMPCTYMSNTKEICWYECGMPNRFQRAEYKATYNNNKKLLRLDINPLQFKYSMLTTYAGLKEKEKLRMIKQIYYILPLIAACSVVSEKKPHKFIEEYIIPQVLMVWIKNNTEFIGIRYYSCSKNDLVRINSGYNVAIPARYDGKNDYSDMLISVFDIDKTKKSKAIDILECFVSKYKSNIEQLKEFYNDLDNEIKFSRTCNIELYLEYHSICKAFIALLDDFYENGPENNYDTIIALTEIKSWGNLLKNVSNEYVNGHSISKEEVKIIEFFNNNVVGFMGCIYAFFKTGELWGN